MAEKTIKVENIIISLNNISKWCGTLAQMLEAVGRDKEFKVPAELHDQICGIPPQNSGNC